MAKKGNRILIRLVSTENTGYFYVTTRNKKKNMEQGMKKIKIKKYDPKVKKHVFFLENKIK